MPIKAKLPPQKEKIVPLKQEMKKLNDESIKKMTDEVRDELNVNVDMESKTRKTYESLLSQIDKVADKLKKNTDDPIESIANVSETIGGNLASEVRNGNVEISAMYKFTKEFIGKAKKENGEQYLPTDSNLFTLMDKLFIGKQQLSKEEMNTLQRQALQMQGMNSQSNAKFNKNNNQQQRKRKGK